MSKTYTTVGWQDGEIVTPAKADLTTGIVTPAEVNGTTPVNAENLRHMDDAIKQLYDEGTTSKDIVIGSEEDATEDTKILIETDSFNCLGTEVVDSLDGNETNMSPSVKVVNDRFKYSTNEVIIGTWEDGKNVYRRTIKTTTSNTANTLKVLGIIENLKEIIAHTISYKTNDNIKYLTDNPSEAPVIFIDASNNINESHKSDYFNTSLITITLIYTKTTD